MEWLELNTLLSKNVLTEHNITTVTNNAFVKKLVKDGRIDELQEMCVQHEYPLVVLAGILSLQRHDNARSHTSALQIAWNCSSTNLPILLPYAFEPLSNLKDVTELNNILKSAILFQPRDSRSAQIAIRQINPKLLDVWFESFPVDNGLPSNVAIIIEQICEYRSDRHLPLTDKIKIWLENHSQIPGMSSTVFFEFYPTENNLFKSILEEKIKDAGTSKNDLYTIVSFRTKLVKSIMEDHASNLRDDRKKEINNILTNLPPSKDAL